MKYSLIIFLICCCLGASAQDSLRAARELNPRKGLPNFYKKLEKGKPVNIAFLGGSITRAGGGYRDQILAWFRKEHPGQEINEIMAAVSGTGSDFGACRVQKHVIDHKPDLVFIEFAVNDNRWVMKFVRETMEGIVRQIWNADKKTDICFVYTFAAENLSVLNNGKLPASATAMEEVADHYGIPSIHMGLTAVDAIKKGELMISGKRDEVLNTPLFSYDGVHPLAETGHRMYTEVLIKNLGLLSHAGRLKHKPGKALEAANWEDAGMLSLESEARFQGDWGSTDSVTRGKEYFQLLPSVRSTNSSDASVTVSFKGGRFGMADIMGPSTSMIEVQIDDQPVRIVNRFDAFSTYYRLNYFIISGLGDGNHTATVKLSSQAPDKSAILKTRNVEVKDWNPYNQRNLYIGSILY